MGIVRGSLWSPLTRGLRAGGHAVDAWPPNPPDLRLWNAAPAYRQHGRYPGLGIARRGARQCWELHVPHGKMGSTPPIMPLPRAASMGRRQASDMGDELWTRIG